MVGQLGRSINGCIDGWMESDGQAGQNGIMGENEGGEGGEGGEGASEGQVGRWHHCILSNGNRLICFRSMGISFDQPCGSSFMEFLVIPNIWNLATPILKFELLY
jgi:hypothetical protein